MVSSRSFPSKLLLALCAALTLASFAHAQALNNTTSTPIPGAGHNYLGLLNEAVNPANGALSVRIEAPMPPSRGLNLPNFLLMYDSNQFSLQPTIYQGNTPTGQIWANVAAANWIPGPSPLFQLIHLVLSIPGAPGAHCDVYTGYMFTDPRGGNHALHVQKADPIDGLGCGPFSSQGVTCPLAPRTRSYDTRIS